jgi:signal transduction histidine kinase
MTTRPPRLQIDDLARLAHELRTPLTALKGYAEAMRLHAFGPLPPPYDAQAGLIYEAASRLDALIAAMASAETARTGLWPVEPARIDAAAVAAEILRLEAGRAAASGVTLTLEAAPGVSEAVADPRALGQILVNLIDNALRHAGRGGTVSVRVAPERSGLAVEVADSGGAAPGEGPGGAGLGLRIVRALCALHGGEFTLRTGPRGAVARALLGGGEEGCAT